jgi:hypothetical protein
LILFILGSIYIFFKPLNIVQKQHGEIPLLELSPFTLYELDTTGLRTIMQGSSGLRYKNRYIVNDINYIDNSRKYLASMQSKKGIYKNDIITLTKDVHYVREDGISFDTQKLIYNKTKAIATSNVGYVAHKDKDTFKGSYIRYNNKKNYIFSKNVTAKIQLDEVSQ